MLDIKILKAIAPNKSVTLSTNGNWTAGEIKAKRIGREVQIDFYNLRAASTTEKSVLNNYLDKEFRPKEEFKQALPYMDGNGTPMCILHIGTNGYISIDATSTAPCYGIYGSVRFIGGGVL